MSNYYLPVESELLKTILENVLDEVQLQDVTTPPPGAVRVAAIINKAADMLVADTPADAANVMEEIAAHCIRAARDIREVNKPSIKTT